MSLAQLDISTEYIGEIVESSTSQFTSESRELNGAPPFGSFVKTIGALPVYGLVFNVCTHSIEPNRRATAYGLTEQELREEQPQILSFSKPNLKLLLLGMATTAVRNRSCPHSRLAFTALFFHVPSRKSKP